MLGLSTSWNAAGTNSAKELIFEIKALGFQAVELSFNLAAPLVEQIACLAKDNEITVLSLHNFCPVPDALPREEALPDVYSLASCDEAERFQALRYTKRTIDTARKTGAMAVVLHCGRVEIPDRTRQLIGLYESGRGDCAEFHQLRRQMLQEREARAGIFFNHALKSIEELNCYAGKQKVLLGIETRFYLREIPSFEEMGIILQEFRGSNIFYWHDAGHAQVMDNLKVAEHKDYLEAYGPRMLGVHLHNVVGCLDHQPPHKGSFDFKRLLPYLKEDTIKIIEAHSPATAEDLKISKNYLEEIFHGRDGKD